MSCITMVFPTASVSEWVWVPTFSSGWLAEDQRWLMASSSLIATPKMLDGLSGSTTKSTWKLSKSNKGQIVAVIWPCLILWWITSFGTIWVGRMLKVVLWMPFPFPQFTSQYIKGTHIAYKWIHWGIHTPTYHTNILLQLPNFEKKPWSMFCHYFWAVKIISIDCLDS